MSGQAQGWVHRHGPHPDHIDRDGKPYGARARGLRSVLLVVADAANADGCHAHPGIDRVAAFSLYSRRQAIHLMAELVAEGWLTVEGVGGGRGMATTYAMGPRYAEGWAEPTPRGPQRPPATMTPVSPVIDPETVQSTAGAGKGAVWPRETVQPGAGKGAVCGETVQPTLHSNGLDNEPPTVLTNARTEPHTWGKLDADAFVEFWEVYPRRIGKGAARKAWPAAVKAAGHPDVILQGARAFQAHAKAHGTEAKFIPHPSTWLRAERWADDLGSDPGPRRPGARPIDPNRDGPEGVIEL